jgi:hypothetical protein
MKGVQKQGVSLTQDESVKGEEEKTLKKEASILGSILKLISRILSTYGTRDKTMATKEEKGN